MIATGRRQHLVTLQSLASTQMTSDSDYAATPSTIGTAWAAIEPATAQRLERLVPGTVIAQATHIVTIPYMAGITTKAQVVFGARTFNVVGVANPEERNIELVLVCVEVTA